MSAFIAPLKTRRLARVGAVLLVVCLCLGATSFVLHHRRQVKNPETNLEELASYTSSGGPVHDWRVRIGSGKYGVMSIGNRLGVYAGRGVFGCSVRQAELGLLTLVLLVGAGVWGISKKK